MSRKFLALAVGALVGIWARAGLVMADDLAVVEACGHGGCCRHGGCSHDGVCVPITQTKKVEKRCYTDNCEQFCLPRCSSFLGLFGGGCGGGCGQGCDHGAACDRGAACHECGHVRVRKYLIVKIKQEEQTVPACKVEQEACAAPAGTIQPVPAKPMPAAKPTTAAQQPQQVQVLEYRYMPMPKK